MKRKTYIVDGFKGQNSKDAPELLNKGECVLMENGFLNEDGMFDGDLIGTLALKTGLSHEPIVIHSWKSNDGYEYVLTWGSDGIVNYYNKTSDSAVVANFITGMPVHFPPEFVNWGNEYIIMLGGQFGNKKIISSGGTLSAADTTDIPSANFGRVANGALRIAQETSIIRSAVNDPLRFTPTREERLAGVYDLNQRLILSSAGVQGETMGYEVWKGFDILWTQYDCYIAAWDGGATVYATKLPGYGLGGFKAWTVDDDRVRFFSSNQHGMIYDIVLGSTGNIGQTFSVGQNIQISVVPVPGAKKITNILNACPKPTAGKKIIAIDSKEDWEGSKIYPALSTLGFDTTTTPGWVSLKGAAALDLTTQSSIIWLTSPGGSAYTDFFAFSETAADGDGDYLDADGHPGPYSATADPTEHVLTVNCNSTSSIYQYFGATMAIWKEDGTRVAFTDKDRKNNTVIEAAGWTSYELETPIKGTGISITYKLTCTNTVSGVFYTKEINIMRTYFFANPAQISKTYIYKFAKSLGGGVDATSTFTIGEVECWGAESATGVITTGPSSTTSLSISGLATGTTDLGVFQISYQGTNDDGTGGLTGATAPTTVEVGIGITTDPAGWGTIDTPTANGSISYMTAAELKVGMKLARLITGLFTFAAGGTLYVRARVPATLQSGSLASPMIDSLIWDFYTGTARKSTFPMFSWKEKTMLSLLSSSSSTECDCAVVINEKGGPTTMDDVKWMAGASLPDMTLVTAGKTLAKFGEGTDNLIGASSTDTPLIRTMTLPKIKGLHKLFARNIKFGISKYIPEGSITTTTGVDVGTASPLLDWATARNGIGWDGLGDGDPGVSVQASDGNVYCLFPYDVTGAKVKIDLVKITPGMVTTRTNIYTAPFVYSTSPAMSMCMSNDGNTLYLFWTGNHETTAAYIKRLAWFRTYNVLTGTLGTATRVDNSDLSDGSYIAISSAVSANGDIYCSFYADIATDIIKIYKSTDGTTFVQDTTVTPYAGNDQALFTNRHGYVSIMYLGVIGTLYCREKTGSGWGTGAVMSALYTNAHHQITCGGADYVVFGDNTGGYYFKIYKNDGTGWTLVKTITNSASYFASSQVFTVYNNMLVLFYTNTGGNLALISGIDDVWSDELAVESVNLGINRLIPRCISGTTPWLLWGWTADPGYWRPFVITNGDMTGVYPLTISVTTESGSNIVYEHWEPITDLTYLPERDQDMRLIQGKYLQAKVSAQGQLQCVGAGVEYDEMEGGL